MKTRTKAFICNMIIIALSLLSIASYFFLPFFKIELSVTLDGTLLQSFLPETESSEEESADYVFSDLTSYLEDEEIPVTLSLSLETSYVLDSYRDDAKDSVQKIIDDNVNTLIEQLYDPLNEIIEKTMRAVSKSVLSAQAKESLKEIYGEQTTDSEIENFFSEANVDIDEKVDEIIDVLYSENATVDEITDAIIENVDEVYQQLSVAHQELEPLTIEQKKEIEEGVKEVLSTFADEEGNVNMDDMLADLLLQLLDGEGIDKIFGEGEEGGELATAQRVSFNENRFLAKESATQKQDSKEELKSRLRTYLTDAIPEETAETIVFVLRIIGYLIFFTFFTWAYLILKILVKTAMPFNAIRLGLPIWLGWLPYLFFSIIPSAAISLLKNPGMLSSISSGLAESVGTVTETMEKFSFKLSFSSCAIVSFIIAIALALFSIFYYGRLRRKLKRIKKGLIVEEINEKPVAENKRASLESREEKDNPKEKVIPKEEVIPKKEDTSNEKDSNNEEDDTSEEDNDEDINLIDE